jgi:hypothetical protein
VAYREFVDDDGTLWRVWDTRPVGADALRSVSPIYAGGWLTFESVSDRRRLAPIPPEWEYASPGLMAHWCARATKVSPDPKREAMRIEGLRPDDRER